MNHRNGLIKRYYSSYYKDFMPKTEAVWNWVLNRFELNFGKFFSAISKDSPILDVACGVGYLEHYLLIRDFSNIHAVDLSEEQINIAKVKLKEFGVEYKNKVTFEVLDAFEYLQKCAGRYDVIVMIDFLEYFKKEDVLELLNLAYTNLRSDGVLILRVINAENPFFGRFFYHDFTHETPFTRDSIKQCLHYTGFNSLSVDYERIPSINSNTLIMNPLKQFLRALVFKLLGTLAGISPKAFSEDLIAVGRK